MEGKELCKKGWNYGETRFEGENMIFEIDTKPVFEIPLTKVMRCDRNETEAILEFDANDEEPVQLTEMRILVPQDPDNIADDADTLEEFRKAVMQFTQIESDSNQLCTLPQLPCITPRGRYDMTIFRSHFSFHGKTYDHNIPFKTIYRTFLLPHKDTRHMFFVFHINPPIRQGQSRYAFVVMQFDKNEHIEVDLDLTPEQLSEEYGNKLELTMKGPFYEVLAKLVRVLVDTRIIVPGKFKGESGTSAISCALRQSLGFLFPLEKGFVFVHKPTLYIRYEEVQNVNFARSDISTKSFDFEVTQKSGHSYLFSSVGKEEYTKLFDFVRGKGLVIRNANRHAKSSYKEVDSGDDVDHYDETIKHDAADGAKGDMDSSSDDEDYDVEADLKKKGKGGEDKSSSSDESEVASDGSNSIHDEL